MIQERKFKILVVDDEVELTNIIGAHLRISGFECELASGGAEALTLLENEKFDLVVCDFVMPGMDGLEFFQETRKKGLNIPFIFCSGLDESPYKTDCPPGVVAFLQKPFPMTDLIDTITKFLLSL